jgi:threonine-phosphate decarboxylase
VDYINIKQNLKSISADIIFLCNPNNPTGELLPREKVIEIAKVCKKLFVDEVFIELSDPRQSVAEFASTRENIFVLRSLTKCFALPGLRIGYGVAGKEMIKELEKYRPPWNLNSIGSELGIFCLTDGKKHLERVREFVKSEREWMVEQLRSAGFHARKSDANFILIRCGNASETRRKLLDENILVRDCTSFGLPDYIRVAVKRRRENRKLINALRMIK